MKQWRQDGSYGAPTVSPKESRIAHSCRSNALKFAKHSEREEHVPPAVRTLGQKQLAVCLSAALALSVADAPLLARVASDSIPLSGWHGPHSVASGVVRSVNSCLDDGTVGTLRQVVSIAGSGDTIDLSAVPLGCSTITLTSGEINESLAVLTFVGPTSHRVTITTDYSGRIFKHTNAINGVLNINDLTISHGRVYSPGTAAQGGCIYAASGIVALTDSTVTGCMAVSGSGSASGGGIYTKGSVEIRRTQLTGNEAYSYYSAATSGGGVTTNSFFAYYSTVSGNSAVAGGGVYAADQVTLRESTVDSNTATYGGGFFRKTNSTFVIAISNSTISGNAATGAGGAMFIGSSLSDPTVSINNSTIAFNRAPQAGGVKAYTNVSANSSIIANNANSSPGGFADLQIVDTGGPPHTLEGSNNLIVSSSLVLADTLTTDPLLVPLGNHGGPTRTHALLANSPAVNHGSNPDTLGLDQRWAAGFAREVPLGSPDIGAYERQATDDEIFYGGFQ